MPDEPDAQKKESPQSSEDIQIPPIPKQTAGAVTGAAIGSVAGPVGAVVGGVVGALAGKAAASGRPSVPAVRKRVAKVVKRAKSKKRVAKVVKRAKSRPAKKRPRSKA